MTEEIRDLNDLGIEAMRAKEWGRASAFFIKSLDRQEDQAHVHYMLGQCYRFLENYDLSIKELFRATTLDGSHKEWFLALGIALQLNGKLDESLDAFRKSNMLDQDYDLAYNSAAITFRKQGDFEKAAMVYDMCIQAIIRKFLFSARNIPNQARAAFFDPRSYLHVNFTIQAMMEHAARTGVSNVQFPSGEMAASEQSEGRYGGLLWLDEDSDKGITRLYLPNCFDTVRLMLASERLYYMCLENKAQTLEELGQNDKAEECLKEASVFHRLFELQRQRMHPQ
jgi:tetratricopeptide (TPR) repeat protein